MGVGDFSPPSFGPPKPVSKQALKRMQANFAQAQVFADQAQEAQEAERAALAPKLDTLIDSTFV